MQKDKPVENFPFNNSPSSEDGKKMPCSTSLEIGFSVFIMLEENCSFKIEKVFFGKNLKLLTKKLYKIQKIENDEEILIARVTQCLGDLNIGTKKKVQ